MAIYEAAAVAVGAEGGTAADDLGGFFSDDVRGNRRHHVAPADGELVPGRQQVAVLPESTAELERGIPARQR